jgi:hypothetical protein
MELNPNHPTTKALSNHWHKIAAIIMVKAGLQEIKITSEDVMAFQGKSIVANGLKDAIVISLVDEAVGRAMAEKAGGLPN